jgi:hypothetical protein
MTLLGCLKIESEMLSAISQLLYPPLEGPPGEGKCTTPELVELKLYLMSRAQGMPIETPAARL